jgi:hypothetical protein
VHREKEKGREERERDKKEEREKREASGVLLTTMMSADYSEYILECALKMHI